MQKLLIIITFALVSIYGNSQFNHINVLTGKTGSNLLLGLVSEFKTSVVLDYSIARDTLFSKIDSVNDSLECIYTGLKLYMAPGQDPTEAVFLNGLPNGINTEHTWPQGLGATGMAQSDMHHLYPSRVKTNSDRGNFIFGEIPDSQVETWYYKAIERTSPPTISRDLYAESIRGNNGKFEPRESVKGNIARSIFYFYTMYKVQADAEDPTFFQKMKSDLCEWHYTDPVDQVEWERNQKIAKYQGDKLNPFVLDCSLVSRAYCNNIDQACQALLSNVVDGHLDEKIKIFPNPGQGTFFLNIKAAMHNGYNVEVKNIFGQSIFLASYEIGNGQNLIEMDLSDYPSGLYMIHVKDINRDINYNMPYVLVK